MSRSNLRFMPAILGFDKIKSYPGKNKYQGINKY